jgi:hypothetical protein
MDPASIASTFVADQAGQTQLALSQKMIKMNAEQQSAIAQMVATAAQQASLPAGIGRNLDITA